MNNFKRFPSCPWRCLRGMFKFSRIVIYRAKSRKSGLEWGDLLSFFNRNNCSLSVGVFSFSLIWESIAAQFLTFVPHGEQTLVEKDSPSSRTTKSSFFSRLANFGNVSPPGSRHKHIFRAYASTRKIAELCFETTARHSTIYLKRLALSAFSLFEEQAQALICWRTATSAHFWSSTVYTTFHYIHTLHFAEKQR